MPSAQTLREPFPPRERLTLAPPTSPLPTPCSMSFADQQAAMAEHAGVQWFAAGGSCMLARQVRGRAGAGRSAATVGCMWNGKPCAQPWELPGVSADVRNLAVTLASSLQDEILVEYDAAMMAPLGVVALGIPEHCQVRPC